MLVPPSPKPNALRSVHAHASSGAAFGLSEERAAKIHRGGHNYTLGSHWSGLLGRPTATGAFSLDFVRRPGLAFQPRSSLPGATPAGIWTCISLMTAARRGALSPPTMNAATLRQELASLGWLSTPPSHTHHRVFKREC
eukprot:scaffold20659_cov64-Phaeocystis_antarctica.AAC.2